MILLLNIFALLLGKENKLQLTINVTEANTNYSYLGLDFYNKYKPKNMDSYMVNYNDTGLKSLELTWENDFSSLEGMFINCHDIFL